MLICDFKGSINKKLGTKCIVKGFQIIFGTVNAMLHNNNIFINVWSYYNKIWNCIAELKKFYG